MLCNAELCFAVMKFSCLNAGSSCELPVLPGSCSQVWFSVYLGNKESDDFQVFFPSKAEYGGFLPIFHFCACVLTCFNLSAQASIEEWTARHTVMAGRPALSQNALVILHQLLSWPTLS